MCVCAAVVSVVSLCVCMSACESACGIVYARMRTLLCVWGVAAGDVPDKAFPDYDPDNCLPNSDVKA